MLLLSRHTICLSWRPEVVGDSCLVLKLGLKLHVTVLTAWESTGLASRALVMLPKYLQFMLAQLAQSFGLFADLNRTLPSNLALEEALTSEDSSIILHVRLQHNKAEWRSSHCLCYDYYLIPEPVRRLDTFISWVWVKAVH